MLKQIEVYEYKGYIVVVDQAHYLDGGNGEARIYEAGLPTYSIVANCASSAEAVKYIDKL